MDKKTKQSVCVIKILFVSFVFLILPISLYAQTRSDDIISIPEEDGSLVKGVRCGTPEPTEEEAANIQKTLDRWIEKHGVRSVPTTAVTIPVAFHIVRKDDGSDGVTDQQIQAQLDVLNGAYAYRGFQFNLHSIDRTNNSAWCTHTMGSSEERGMKENLAIDPTSILNFYTCDVNGNPKPLGYSTLPWHYPEDSFMHGVVILYSTLPGGSLAWYDKGDTAVHEVGHYLGLWHTFQNGCASLGDYVDDTPYQHDGSNRLECDEALDTCSQPGTDPVHNYMNYTNDDCLNEFTPGQVQRMNNMVALHKPTLIESGTPANLVLANRTITTTQTFEATNSITAGPDLTITSTAKVTFHVINENGVGIILKPGFTAYGNSTFRAYID